MASLASLQPSQLYVSVRKLERVLGQLDTGGPAVLEPVPVKVLDGRDVLTDGHTRALAAHLAGLARIPTRPEEDELSWTAYRICVRWCREEGVRSVADLAGRVVSEEDYQRLWLDRCRRMQEGISRGPVAARVERAWREVEEIEAAYERGEVDRAGWHERMAALVVPAYLRGTNPRAQSGYGGTDADWKQARGLVAEAIIRSGTFLDVGAANGHLMESVVAWCAARGVAVEPWGLEIAPELAELARWRLPRWADRILTGNAATWTPPFRFDWVRTGLEYVPRPRRAELLAHLLEHVVAPGGYLLVGPFTEERDETRPGPSTEEEVVRYGFRVVDRRERPHPRDERVIRRLLVLENLPGAVR